ncbi:MAG: glycosyltransferase [Elusimicrobia bacterium]|nr:glycosyltransferase [Elusimicrobiota bacterium]
MFFYITISSGHQKAAEAVMNALRQMNHRVEGHGIDSISYVYPVVGRMISRLYLNILKHTPQVWDYLYDNPTVEGATRDIRDLLHVLNVGKIYKILKRYRPRCLICTQAVPASILAALKQRGKMKIPLVCILTDYGVHNYWLSNHVDLYAVPTEDIKRIMLRRGIRESRILVTGIPVDPYFAVKGEKRLERMRIGFHPDVPTLLVMGGSRGLGPMDEVVSALQHLTKDVQVIVVCGNNRKLLKDLNAKFASDRSVRIFGHTRNVSRLMDAADILISKPGGLTSAESLAKGLPLVMIRPIPGQEERNARFLMKHGAAERVENLEELQRAVRRLLDDKHRMNELKTKAQALAKPLAAFEIGEAVLKMIKEPVLVRPAALVEKMRSPAGGSAMSHTPLITV